MANLNSFIHSLIQHSYTVDWQCTPNVKNAKELKKRLLNNNFDTRKEILHVNHDFQMCIQVLQNQFGLDTYTCVTVPIYELFPNAYLRISYEIFSSLFCRKKTISRVAFRFSDTRVMGVSAM